MNRIRLASLLAPSVLAVGSLTACTGPVGGPIDSQFLKVDPGKADSSAEAAFVDFEFDGELVTNQAWNPEKQIEDQLLYTIGHLNGSRSVGRLDRVELENVETSTEDGMTRVTYHARLPVAWGRRDDVPETYTLTLPRDVSYAGLDRFAEQYGHHCVDYGAHDVDSGSMWYYYRPAQSRCSLAPEDVVELEATVTPSDRQTTGKFPEYDRVWEDDQLRVVAVYGKYEDGATTAADAGIAAYNRFVQEIRRELSQYDVQTTPEEVPSNPGVELPEITFRAELGDGKSVEVVALLVDNVRTAGRQFDERYAELSPNADLITYNGHAGLGSNIRALARKGRWIQGQYAVVFMNGCDTYAYVDSALWDAHAEVNPDDPTGTKYLDLVSNALPSYFRSMPYATMALVRGLLSYQEPMTYEQIFGDVDSSQVILVSGEEDNTFVPGGGGDDDDPPPADWAGLEGSGTVARGETKLYTSGQVPAGRYVFTLAGSGDADLYVRIGSAPTLRSYDCRPYLSGSSETCEVDLAGASEIHVMVAGYATSSDFTLTGSRH